MQSLLLKISGLSHGQQKLGNQEKSGKTKKKDKSQEKSGKNGGFCKKSGKSQEFFFKKPQIMSVQIYLIPFISKPLISKKIIKNSLKSD